jgi:preprotein translocase subunit SecA
MNASGILSKVLKTFVGSKTDRDFKELSPIIDEVALHYDAISSLSNDELRAKTTELKGRIATKTKAKDDEVVALKAQIETDLKLSIVEKENIYAKIDALGKEILEQLEEVLTEIRGEAFAVVKETSKRFAENKRVEVTANQMDRDMAAERESVEINGDKAIYHNSWLAAGVEVSGAMVHYDVQLIGG